MLKIVVFDSGYGGELLADYLEDALPVIDIVRAINWREAEIIQHSSRLSRKLSEKFLQPYIGKVDLIVIANFFISATSLKYLQRKYKNQKFIGLNLNPKNLSKVKSTVTFTTKAMSKTISYFQYARQIKTKTIVLDDWPILIDDGELGHGKIRRDLASVIKDKPSQLFLACGQFVDLKVELKRLFGHNIKIVDNFDQVLHQTCQTLKIRGSLKKQK